MSTGPPTSFPSAAAKDPRASQQTASAPPFVAGPPTSHQTLRHPLIPHRGAHGETSYSHADTAITLTTSDSKSSTIAPTTIAAISSAGAAPSKTSLPASSSASEQLSSAEQRVSRTRVVFGHGTIARLPAELGHLNLSAPLIVSSPSRIALARRIQTLIPNLGSRILDSSLTNTSARVVDDAVARITDRDCVVSVGGGSAISLAKAIGTSKKIPHICIPTTYSASEVSPLLGHARNGDGRHLANWHATTLPTIVIYDEDLTASRMNRFSAPNLVAPSLSDTSSLGSSKDEKSQWSYLHLPGV